ncbi:protein PEP-RELATED DEVELOPMENT ARRESTED 1, chloroplastic [Cocos nucifera]|uniref:Protein PEP-RELATED DEVELOPMENT ARRESTED 1, chloroplastic n=1 Tax=Cocos nucifera TaxID=13894 RepID=A0A8K0I0D2_COCNU|nr:protein PEP-RELATED DEVELOPMENT ARRESTED 1, chloroplastic [Cocos nucifera]
MVAALFFSPSTFPSALSSLRTPTSTTLSSTLLRLHSPTPLSFCPKSHHPTNTSFLCFSHWSEAEAPFSTSDFPSLYPENDEKWDSSKYEALLKGGKQVTSVLQDMVKLLEDMELDAESERAAVEIAAQGVIGKRVDEMESGFMMAIDYMIQIAEKDNDDKRKVLLEVIKQTVLDHLTKKCPPHVQVIGLLCRTPQKESRHELLRRVAAGGGVFKSDNNFKVQLPGANLNDIANQADDLLETMESRRTIPDRKLLARLVLIREEARNMMGGGILDERNDRGLSTLPEAEVNFLSKLVALRPGQAVQKMISDVMHGKDEGADNLDSGDEDPNNRQKMLSGISGRGSVTGRKPRPVRPGMFLETVSKVLGGIYSGNVSGITAQHLEWVHQKTLEILQEMAF